MKNLSLILNAVLFVLVGVLFYLHFSGSKTSHAPQQIIANGKTLNIPQIAYIDIDSFQAHYEYFIIKKAEIEASQKAMESELQRKGSAFQAKYQAFMQKAETMTQEEGAAAQEQLAAEKQNLDDLYQNNDATIMKRTNEFQVEIKNRIIAFLKKYNADGRYTYILPYSEDQINLLYVTPGYNVTDDVIKGMNEEYKENKK